MRVQDISLKQQTGEMFDNVQAPSGVPISSKSDKLLTAGCFQRWAESLAGTKKQGREIPERCCPSGAGFKSPKCETLLAKNLFYSQTVKV